jgi:methylated-DNA-protein-cysteine methyltransferase related protein
MAKRGERSEFTERIIAVIRGIPEGRVLTYGGAAALAGNARGARAVVWVLNSSSEKEELPWHRVINSRGSISLRPGYGFELQKQLLESEGIEVSGRGVIDLEKYLWDGGGPDRHTVQGGEWFDG